MWEVLLYTIVFAASFAVVFAILTRYVRRVRVEPPRREDLEDELYRTGFWRGVGLSAMVLSFVTYLSLLGFEKAILAIVLGGLTMRGAPKGTPAWLGGLGAVVVAGAFMVCAAVMLAVNWGKVIELINLLQKLS